MVPWFLVSFARETRSRDGQGGDMENDSGSDEVIELEAHCVFRNAPEFGKIS